MTRESRFGLVNEREQRSCKRKMYCILVYEHYLCNKKKPGDGNPQKAENKRATTEDKSPQPLWSI